VLTPFIEKAKIKGAISRQKKRKIEQKKKTTEEEGKEVIELEGRRKGKGVGAFRIPGVKGKGGGKKNEGYLSLSKKKKGKPGVSSDYFKRTQKGAAEKKIKNAHHGSLTSATM